MATLSSHLLNSVDGTHASGVKVIINQINSLGVKKIYFETETDDGGRILKDFELSNDDCRCCLLYTSPSPRDRTRSRMPSSA